MKILLWALGLIILSWHSSFASPSSELGSTSQDPDCPDGCVCSRDLRTVQCTGIDPYTTLHNLTNRYTETLTLEDCFIPEESFNQTYTDLNFGYMTFLSLKECPLNSSNLMDGYHSAFHRLRVLEISDSGEDPFAAIDCDFMEHLEDIRIVNTSLDQNPLPNCDTNSLRSLNFSHNSLMQFDMQDLTSFTKLKTLDLSNNNLKIVTPSSAKLSIKTLKLSDNPELTAVCTKLLRSLPELKELDVSRTGIFQLSLGLLEHKNIQTLSTEGVDFKCNCQTTLRLESMSSRELFENLDCSSPVSGTKFKITDANLLNSLDCGADLQEQPLSEYRHRAGETVYLDCPLDGGFTGYEVLWMSPRRDLMRLVPEPEQVCSPAQDLYQPSLFTKDYSYWDDHYRVLPNGSLRIDEFGWRDRGAYTCFASNGLQNSSAKLYLKLNYHYRNKIYYLSLAWGFGVAACFLGLTLLGKLLHYLLWNYGCCLCCGCCKEQQPPKIKKLTKVVDSIEVYRIQQLEKLRENYNMQSQRIRDNCVMQMEKVRENYHTQVKGLKDMKNYGSAQCTGVKDQYTDQISKIREYSSGQLDKCHENYIFQRQRLRKFSAQNYLRIRETKQYTQKTLNRVLVNMPSLYLDLSSCKQGIGDQDLREWQDEMDRREAEMRDILNTDRALDLEGLGDSQSLYFTPTGTPFRDISSNKGTPVRDEAGRIIYSPSRSPEKGIKQRGGHKRMVSNLSTLFPFWWGISQSEEVETIAIVEPLRQEDEDDCIIKTSDYNEVDYNKEEQSIPLLAPKAGNDDSPEIGPNASVSNQNSPSRATAEMLHNSHSYDAAMPLSQQLLGKNVELEGEDMLLRVGRHGTDQLLDKTNANLNRSNSLPTDIGEPVLYTLPHPLPTEPPPQNTKPFPVLVADKDSNKNLQQHRSVEILSTSSPSAQAFGGEVALRRSASLVPTGGFGLPPDFLVPGENALGMGGVGLEESITESSITDSGIKDCGDEEFGEMKGFLGLGHMDQGEPAPALPALKLMPEQIQSAEPTLKGIVYPQLEDSAIADTVVTDHEKEDQVLSDGNVKAATTTLGDRTKMADECSTSSKVDDQVTVVAIVTDDHNYEPPKDVSGGKADYTYLDIEMTDSVAVTNDYEM